MDMKGIIILLALAAFPVRTLADVIYSRNRMGNGVVVSLEAVASRESPFGQGKSVDLWAGLGLVSPVDEMEHPSYGIEAAVELRDYISRKGMRGFNAGAYVGLALMRNPVVRQGRVERYGSTIGFVPGAKLTYKVPSSGRFFWEPYAGLSFPVYGRLDDAGEAEDPKLVVTLGMRLGLGTANRDTSRGRP